jgi:predicted PurR-regulated permease PerM
VSARRAPPDRVFIERSLRVAIVAAAALAAVFGLLWVLKGALTPLVSALLLAYLFDPLIDRFEARRVRRGLAVVIVVLVLGVVVVGFLVFLLPRVIAEMAVLGQELPAYLERVLVQLIPRFEETTGVAVPRTVEELLQRVRAGELQLPLDALRSLLQQLVGFVTGTVSGLIGLLVVPVLAYYCLVEFDVLKPRALSLVPMRHREWVTEKARTVDALVSGFLRGQLIVATTLGVLYAVGFTLIGIDLAVGVGLLAGALALVPYLGNVVAVVAATVLCVLKFGVDVHLALVLGWYAIVQNLEGFVLTPRIVGSSVGLHPALVIVALLIGGDLFGFLGLLVAVPLAAVANVFIEDAFDAYRATALYREAGAPEPAPPDVEI